MASEAVAVAQRFFDLVAARDFTSISDLLDPDVVWLGTRGGLDQDRIVRGPNAFLEFLREVLEESWERFDVETEQLIEAGDAVVVFLHEAARARHGDLEVENETAAIFKVRQRKIVEARGYLDRDEALRAAGFVD